MNRPGGCGKRAVRGNLREKAREVEGRGTALGDFPDASGTVRVSRSARRLFSRAEVRTVSAVASRGAKPLNFPGVTVLVVDDNEDFRTILATWIEEEFHRPVCVACDGQEATLAFTDPGRDPPVLVLLDLEMPIMDGRTFLGWLRAHVAPLPRVVLVSASSSLPKVAKELGVEHAAKPITVARLRELLAERPGVSAP